MMQLLLALLLLLLASACQSFILPAQAPPTGILRWSIEGVPDLPNFDPARISSQQSITVSQLIFAGLVRLDADLKVQPDGAERWQVSADGTTYTFRIRRNLRFGNGDPVTAHDFVYSFNRALDPEHAAFGIREQLSHIVGVEDMVAGRASTVQGIRALDDHTLEIQLDSPRAFFLSQLALSFSFVVPRQLIAEAGEDWIETAYGTGPFRVQEWRHGTEIVLTANPHYWRGTPGLAGVRLPFYPDSAEAYQDYQHGKLDITGSSQSGIPATRVAEVQALPDFRTAPALIVRYIGFNNQLPPFDSVFVRRAFALAVDKQTLTQQILSNTVIATDRILPTGMAGSQLAVKGLGFDPVGARAALNLAGYAGTQDVPPITLTYGQEGDNAIVAEALRRFWRDTLGVEVTLEGLDLTTFIDRLDETYYHPEQGLHMYLSVWGADYPDPQNFLSQQLYTISPNNNGHWSHAEFDQLVDQADRMGAQQQREQRLRLYHAAEQIAVTDVGWLPLYSPRVNVLVRPTVQGLIFTPQGLVANDWTRVRIVATEQDDT